MQTEAPKEHQIAVVPQEPQTKRTEPAEVLFQTGVKMVEVDKLNFMDNEDEEIIRQEQMVLLAEVEHHKDICQKRQRWNPPSGSRTFKLDMIKEQWSKR